MAKFKDYNGNEISVPTHTHVVEDTQRDGETAIASTTNTGFMKKVDVNKLNYLESQASVIEEKVKTMVFTSSN